MKNFIFVLFLSTLLAFASSTDPLQKVPSTSLKPHCELQKVLGFDDVCVQFVINNIIKDGNTVVCYNTLNKEHYEYLKAYNALPKDNRTNICKFQRVSQTHRTIMDLEDWVKYGYEFQKKTEKALVFCEFIKKNLQYDYKKNINLSFEYLIEKTKDTKYECDDK